MRNSQHRHSQTVTIDPNASLAVPNNRTANKSNNISIPSVHHLPCTIHCDSAEAEIESYFYGSIHPPLSSKHRAKQEALARSNEPPPSPATTTESDGDNRESMSESAPEEEVPNTADQKFYTSSIRGRPIKGHIVALPSDTLGVILTKGNGHHHGGVIDLDNGYDSDDEYDGNRDATSTATSAVDWRACETFQKMMVWALDADPSERSSINGALSWLSISQKVHECVMDIDDYTSDKEEEEGKEAVEAVEEKQVQDKLE